MRDENQTSDSARVVLAVAQHKGCTSKEVKLIEHMVRTLVVQDSATDANSYGAIKVAAEPALPAPQDVTPDEPIEVMAHPWASKPVPLWAPLW